MKKLAFVLMAILVAAVGLFAIAAVSVQAGAFPDEIPLPDGWFPEGIATGRGTDFYVGSLVDGGIYKGDLSTGGGSELPTAEPGTMAVGLSYDSRSNNLFVAGGGPVFGPVQPAIRVFDGQSGQQLAEYFVNGGFVNDVVVTRDAAYFTDSFFPQYYVLPLSAAGALPAAAVQPQIVPLTGDFQSAGGFNANGIEATPDGAWLLVVNATTGLLYRVDPSTGVAQEIDLGGALLDGGDGILLEGKTLYVVRGPVVTVVALSPDFLSGTVVDDLAIPDAINPTTVAGFGDSLYTVDANFELFGDPTVPFNVQRIAK